MDIKIGASLACANILELGKDLEDLVKNNIDFFHIDIMDGIFVKNYCFGTNTLDYLASYKNIELDVHMMVCDPFDKVDFFKDKILHRLSFHIEASSNPIQTLKKIKSFGFKAGIAINAATAESSLNYIYEFTDFILVMSVEAGFTGQKFIDTSVDKVKKIRCELEKRNIKIGICVDGHIEPSTIKRLSDAGANEFVVGSAGLFVKGRSIEANMENLKKSIFK